MEVAESTTRGYVRERKIQLALLHRETFIPQSYVWGVGHASQPGEQQEELLHEDLSWDNHGKWDHRLKFLAGRRIMPVEWLLGRDGQRKMSW